MEIIPFDNPEKEGEFMADIVVTQKNGIIEANFDEVKAFLDEKLEIYRNMVFTEDSKTDAKKTVAELRKLKDSIDTKRKEAKKEYMKPYEDFEAKMKELTGMVDVPIKYINDQTQAFEASRKEEKRKEIQKIYSSIMPEDLKEILTLERIYDPKWENATVREKDIRDSIQTSVVNLRSDIGTIKSMGEECEEEALKALYRTLNISDAIAYITDYRKKKEMVLEAERKRKETVEVHEEVSETKTEQAIEPVAESSITATFEIYGDYFDIARAEVVLEEAGIEYRRVR